MIPNTAKICENLQLKDRGGKIATLKQMQEICLDTKGFTDVDILNIFDETYLYFLECYSDRFESVREQAIQTVNMFVERLPPNDFHLVNIVSTLVKRMGQEETVEESEEIRLGFMHQLLNLQNKYIKTRNEISLQDCYTYLMAVNLKALKDPYPAVQIKACTCIVELAVSTENFIFKEYSECLANGLYGMLNHKHSQSRIAAIKALGYVALHFDSSSDALSRLTMEVSPLLMDSMPLVRRECGELGTRLLIDLRDRYSYFERLVPFVLCCLKDDSPEVQEYISPMWEKCGKQYYDENEAELRQEETADVKALNYPPNIARPTIGCRKIVQRSTCVLKLIMRESTDWKENVRLHSLKLLYQFILHAEATMTGKFFEVYGDIARALTDVEPTIVQEAVRVSDLMGRLLNYNDWCQYGFEGLEKNAKLGYLKCFYYMYAASNGVKFEHILRLSRILVQKEFSQSLNSNFQLYVLKMIENILDKFETENMKEDSLELCRNCYCSAIKVMSLCLEYDDCEELQTKGLNILLKMSDICKCEIDDLHENFLIYALKYVKNIDAPLEAISEPILLLYGLVKLTKFRPNYLTALQQKINIVFGSGLDESKVKIFSAVSVAMLDWNMTFRRSVTESSVVLKEFLISVVEPHLIWKPGANAEAMRSLAVATLCALSQGAVEEAKQVLPYFAKFMPPLLEDQCVSTRHYSIKCLYNFGEIDIEDLKPIAYGCLQRLNDPSSGIRILAASVIPKLQPKLNENITNVIENDSNEVRTHEYAIWVSFIENCFNILYLHYDNPDVRLQEVIKDTLIELSKRYPRISKISYDHTLSITHNYYSLKELKAELPLI